MLDGLRWWNSGISLLIQNPRDQDLQRAMNIYPCGRARDDDVFQVVLMHGLEELQPRGLLQPQGFEEKFVNGPMLNLMLI